MPQPQKAGGHHENLSRRKTNFFGKYVCLFFFIKSLPLLLEWESETYYFKTYLKMKHFLSFMEQAWVTKQNARVCVHF